MLTPNRSTLVALAMLISPFFGAWAADRPDPKAAESAPAENADASNVNSNLLIVVHAFRQGREIKVAFTTMSGTQANFKVNDDTARASLIVNVLPAVMPERAGMIETQYQIEVSDDGRKAGFQVQGQARVADGKAKTLMESRNDKVTIEISIEP